MINVSDNLDFKMLAEWEKHSALWLAWPHDVISFGSLNAKDGISDTGRLGRVEQIYISIIKNIHQSEIVKLLVLDENMKLKVTEMLQTVGVDMSRVVFYITDYADVWARDYGPMFVKQGNKKSWVKWNYFAYGGKFPALIKDNKVFLNLVDKVEGDMIRPNIFMEGGAIEVNGDGVLITTEQCLLNSNRNPELSKSQIENILMKTLGVKKIIWLKDGLVNDHTDGHIDDLIKFVNTNTILVSYEEDTTHPNFKNLDENYKILEQATDQNGKKFNLIKIPLPHMTYTNGEPAPASYANFYIGNDVVLVPTYNDPNDQKALHLIQSYFPNRKVVGINCTDLIYGGGAIHCITQQEIA